MIYLHYRIIICLPGAVAALTRVKRWLNLSLCSFWSYQGTQPCATLWFSSPAASAQPDTVTIITVPVFTVAHVGQIYGGPLSAWSTNFCTVHAQTDSKIESKSACLWHWRVCKSKFFDLGDSIVIMSPITQ